MIVRDLGLVSVKCYHYTSLEYGLTKRLLVTSVSVSLQLGLHFSYFANFYIFIFNYSQG